MCPTTTPQPDRLAELLAARDAAIANLERWRAKHALGTVTVQLDPSTGRSDVVRLIQTTDDLLTEVLRRPGQLFVVSHGLRGTGRGTELAQWTYLEFADGDRVEIRYAR